MKLCSAPAVLACWGLALVILAAPAAARPAQAVKAEALLTAWQLEDAMAIAQKWLADAPKEPAARHLAAQVLHQRGQHGAALALLRDFSSADHGRGHADPSSLRALVEASAAYEAHFEERTTAHFRIHYIDKDEVLAVYAEHVLEAAYANIGADLEFYPAERGEKIVVEIYPDAHGLAGATGLTVKEIATSGTIAVCKFHRLMITSPLATLGGYSWADTLAHEFTHLLISKKSRNTVPIWLHEGIAKYFESRWRAQAGLGLSPYGENLLQDAVRSKKFVTFAQMHPSMALLPSQDDAALAFAEVFTVIEYIVQHFGTRGLAAILRLGSEGVTIPDALVQVLHMDLNKLEQTWKHGLASRKFQSHPDAVPRRIKLRELQSGDASKGPTGPSRAAVDKNVHDAARLGELLQLRGHLAAAVREYDKAMALGGARYPDLVVRVARALNEGGRREEAWAMLEKVTTAHPDNADAQLLAGRVSLGLHKEDAAQRHFEAVRLQNPYNPELHGVLAALYARQGNKGAAEEELRLGNMCDQARPQIHIAVPEAAVGEAYVSLVTQPWGEVQLDLSRLQSPAWNVAVKAGKHRASFLAPDGQRRQADVEVGPGGRAVTVLR